VTSLARDLQSFYDAEATQRAGRDLGPFRTGLRDEFVALVRAEQRRNVLEVGCGPGRDAAALTSAGLTTVACDLSFAPLQLAVTRGVTAVQASMLTLPFATGRFAAAWTMSTFVHVPDAVVATAIGELVRVVEPGGLIGIGTWGGVDAEAVSDRDSIQPARLFCRRSHARWRLLLSEHGDVERFDAFDLGEQPAGWDYQFAIVRTPPSR
jgi:SAM-dependent methyltransferase